MSQPNRPKSIRTARNYTPYGQAQGVTEGLTAFVGAYHDPFSGSYLLGNGYRAYSPSLMRFRSADRLSPFGDGGTNAYAYCSADPINNRDPSGAAPTRRGPPAPITDVPSIAFEYGHVESRLSVQSVGQALLATSDAAAVLDNVVTAMEVLQQGRQLSFRERIVAVASTWNAGLSFVGSLMELPGAIQSASSMTGGARLVFATGASGVIGYADVPERLQRLWHNAPSVGAFASLTLRGASSAAGLDQAKHMTAMVMRMAMRTIRQGSQITSGDRLPV